MKKLLLFLPLLLSLLFVNAQFGPQVDISKSISGVNDVKCFDLDNDGDLDVLSASYYDDKIAWYENLGGGVFGIQRIITTIADQALSVYATDIDGDGDLDVLSASWNDDKIAWYENLGAGIFSGQKIITTNANGATSVYSADLDNDGDMDVLSASWYDNKIAWYENLGGGSFGSQQIITINAISPYSVYAEDLDNDGDIDILSASSSDDKIAWYENMGSGSFGPQQIITTNADGAYCVYSIDLDNDGDKDVLSASKVDDKIAWYENLGGGSFGSQQIITTNADGACYVYSIDLDNDGDKDVLSASNNDNKIAWYENLSGGNFGPQQIIMSILGAKNVYAGDIDNDGFIDVLSLFNHNAEGQYLAWNKNLSFGNFGVAQFINKNADNVRYLRVADLDGDGDNDVVFASEVEDIIAWYANNGYGVFGERQIISNNTIYAQSVYTADIDNDGDIDIISGSGVDDKIAWYENLGSGSFGSQQIISTNANNPRCVFATDLDNDGDMDVLSASYSDNKIAWYENMGSGSFGPQQIISTNAIYAMSVRADDLDNDGDMDVLSASYGDNKIAWYENMGGGIIDTTQNVISINANGTRFVFAADLDNDGDIDVLSASNNDHKIAWYENLGGGIIDTVQKIISNNAIYANCVSAADIDNDGYIDVLSASGDDDKIAWYKNLGSGNFSSEKFVNIPDNDGNLSNESTGNAYFAVFVTTADLDGDGDLDVLSSSLFDNKIAWYENFYGSQYKLIGDVFYDENQNQHKDTNEIGLDFIHISLFPNNAYSYTNDGYYSFTSDSGTFTVNHSFVDPLWSLTTDSLAYTVTLSGANPIADSLDFGFYPNTITTIIKSELTGAFPRCNDTINYWANIRNEGTTTPNGILHLQLDDSISFVSSVIAPDSIIGQNIYWHFDSLFFYAEEMINLQVQMPPFTSMGNTLISILSVYELDGSNNIVYTNTDTLNQVLVCAYDPNDKTVLPKGIGPQGFVANNQPMEYLIRFQNTGNDTALTVMVRDQLDDNLDWGSLKPLASSHPMQVWIEQDGEAVFKFNNIMLPDSNVDFIGSQGFVKFSINQKPNLSPGTPIFNTGHIYFDNNPAVITNTVLNTIEDTISFPVSVQEINFTETNEIIVFPNPFTEHITVYYKAKINTTYHVSLYDMSGKELLKRENITNNKTELDVSHLKNGIYILVGTDHVGKKLFSQRIVAQ